MAGPNIGVAMCLAITGCILVRPHRVHAAFGHERAYVYKYMAHTSYNIMKRKNATYAIRSMDERAQ